MEISPMIIFIWKVFIVIQLCRMVVYVGVYRPSWLAILGNIFELTMLVSMIFFGFEIISEIPSWTQFTRLGQYILLMIMWLIVFGITSAFNSKIRPIK